MSTTEARASVERNRDRLKRAAADIAAIAADHAISPTPYAALMQALAQIELASAYPLDLPEWEVRS